VVCRPTAVEYDCTLKQADGFRKTSPGDRDHTEQKVPVGVTRVVRQYIQAAPLRLRVSSPVQVIPGLFEPPVQVGIGFAGQGS
jgi:hypothetical protein